MTRQTKQQHIDLSSQTASIDNESSTEDQHGDDDDDIITIWPQYEEIVPVSIPHVEVLGDISISGENCCEESELGQQTQRSTEDPTVATIPMRVDAEPFVPSCREPIIDDTLPLDDVTTQTSTLSQMETDSIGVSSEETKHMTNKHADDGEGDKVWTTSLDNDL